MRDGGERWDGGDELLLRPRLEMDGGALGNSAAMIGVGSRARVINCKHRGIESRQASGRLMRPRRREASHRELPPKHIQSRPLRLAAASNIHIHHHSALLLLD
jgi:hypothetical protein